MQKTYNISCCAECPAYRTRGLMPCCGKLKKRIDEDTESFVNPALIGFPEWCPLESVTASGSNSDYKRVIKQIIKIMQDNQSPDALQEASHFLNLVVENEKKKTEKNQL